MSNNEQVPNLVLESSELTPAQKVRLEMLAKTHVGQQIMTDFVFSGKTSTPTETTHDYFVQLEKLTQWVLAAS